MTTEKKKTIKRCLTPLKYCRFKPNYKYRTGQFVIFYLPELKGFDCKTKFLHLNKHGYLRIETRFGWDGASGPTFDTDSSMHGGLCHDALFELMSRGLIPLQLIVAANRLLRDICIEKDMWEWRADYWYKGVQLFGLKHAKPKKIKYRIIK